MPVSSVRSGQQFRGYGRGGGRSSSQRKSKLWLPRVSASLDSLKDATRRGLRRNFYAWEWGRPLVPVDFPGPRIDLRCAWLFWGKACFWPASQWNLAACSRVGLGSSRSGGPEPDDLASRASDLSSPPPPRAKATFRCLCALKRFGFAEGSLTGPNAHVVWSVTEMVACGRM